VHGLVVSPGPGRPEAAGVSIEIVGAFAERGIPVLGVCLGHQAIGERFGGRIVRARSIMHGKVSPIHHQGQGVFVGLPSPMEATRYHSLVIEDASRPDVLEVTARTPDGEIMGVRHRELPAEGVQFHPESIMTGQGKPLLANFLARCEVARG
jgi:anthranilate synthase/aminodeoxychorismate synthase-like glutamine amidotransferase